MSWRSRLEGVSLVLALLLVGAFLASAVVGVRLHRAGAAAGALPGADSAAVPAAYDGTGIRVEVLNGSGRPGLAREATEHLRAAGFDVVYFGNATVPRGISLVLDRGGRADAARGAAAVLGIAAVRGEPDAGRYVDVTVILAKDWPPAPPAAKEGWLDRVRRWARAAL